MVDWVTGCRRGNLLARLNRPSLMRAVRWSTMGRIWLVAALLVALPARGAPAGPERQPHFLAFGVLPLQSPTKLAGMFMPLVEGIQTALGQPVEFVTAPSFATFMKRVMARRYDFVYLNPLLLRRAEKAGYHAVAKVAREPFTGILVVRRDSPLHSLNPATLPKGLRIGFPDPNAYAATVMTTQYMKKLGIDVHREFSIKYFGSQNSAIMAVYAGLVDVAGTWWPSLRSMPPDVQKALRVIAETPPQPQMPIAVRSGMAPERVRKLTRYLTSLTHSASGRRILQHLGFKHGFAAADDSEYAKVGQ